MNQSLARRLRWPLLLLGLLAVLVGVAGWLLLPADPIGPRAFERIQLGMTEEEVEAVMGSPAGSYVSETITDAQLIRRRYLIEWKRMDSDNGKRYSKAWHGDSYWIQVDVNEQGKALAAGLFDKRTDLSQPTFLDRLRAWLGL